MYMCVCFVPVKCVKGRVTCHVYVCLKCKFQESDLSCICVFEV